MISFAEVLPHSGKSVHTREGKGWAVTETVYCGYWMFCMSASNTVEAERSPLLRFMKYTVSGKRTANQNQIIATTIAEEMRRTNSSKKLTEMLRYSNSPT